MRWDDRKRDLTEGESQTSVKASVKTTFDVWPILAAHLPKTYGPKDATA